MRALCLRGGRISSAHASASLVRRLTLEDKARLVAGADMWTTRPADGIGVRSLNLSDGPNGVRGPRFFDERDVAHCTPCGSALGATWDTEVVRTVGLAVGGEARNQRVDVVLGPNLNLHRTPLGGRGFECLSEDPLLAGVLGAAWIEGVQSHGVAATPKHLVGDDAERSRTTVDCRTDEQTLREIHLVPFEHAVRAGAWTMMAAYNQLNGEHCAENSALLHIVKSEWGFDGLVMSDWFGAHDTVGSAPAGLDLEMPGPGRVFGEALVEAVRRGDVDESVLDDKVERLLLLAARVGGAQPEEALVDDIDEALAQRGGGQLRPPAQRIRAAPAGRRTAEAHRRRRPERRRPVHPGRRKRARTRGRLRLRWRRSAIASPTRRAYTRSGA